MKSIISRCKSADQQKIGRALWLMTISIVLASIVLYAEYTRRYLSTKSVVPPNAMMVSSSLDGELEAEQNPELNMIVVVFTAPQNFERRAAMRETWLSSRWRSAYRFNYTFLLGRSHKTNVNDTRMLEAEQKKHGDLVIAETFIDTYLNLTYKSIEMLRFIDATYSNTSTRYLVKVDDDTFLNMPRLVEAAVESEIKAGNGTFLAGLVSRGVGPRRHPKDKYYMPYSMYNFTVYPPFVHGPAYIVSIGAIQSLLQAASVTPFVHLEDIYLALLANASDLQLVEVGEFSLYPAENWCEMRKLRCAHYMKPQMMRQVWSDYIDEVVHKKLINCQLVENQRKNSFGHLLALVAFLILFVFMFCTAGCVLCVKVCRRIGNEMFENSFGSIATPVHNAKPRRARRSKQ